jgi:hypothetical protein
MFRFYQSLLRLKIIFSSTDQEDRTQLYCRSEDALTSDGVWTMLNDPGLTKVSTIARMHPQGGDVYVFT